MEKNSIVQEQLSPFGFEETVEILLENARKANWNNPAVHDLQQSLAKSGQSVRPVKVIELCKPEYSGKMLELNDERIISVLMPCRISVYQKEDQKTYVSQINIGALSAGLQDHVANVMMAASEDVQALVDGLVTP